MTDCRALPVMVLEVLTPHGHLIKSVACDEHARDYLTAWSQLQRLDLVPGDFIASAHANPDAPVPYWPADLVTS